MKSILLSAATVSVLAIAACAPPPPRLPAPQLIDAPDPGQVESVIFLIGDAGEAQPGASPVLARLKEDLDWWAERLEGDSAIVTLFLGDIIYPLGLHDRDHPDFPQDSSNVMAQVEVLSSPAATERAHGFFLMGNHDWGLEEDWEGFVRVARLEDFLAGASVQTGASIRVAPDPGTGGPYVLDVGEHVRLLLLDTAWWLLDGGRLGMDSRGEVLSAIHTAMEEADGREIFFAAHHPFRSAGPHGGQFNFWRTLGLRYVLARSGAVLQDITSVPYRELANGLRAIFAATGPPLGFIGGHEHSLQLFAGLERLDPRFSLVSGSGSKLSRVGHQPDILFGQSAPGYMRIVIEHGGEIKLYVEAAPPEYLHCSTEEPARTECMSDGLAAFRTVHSQRLQ